MAAITGLPNFFNTQKPVAQDFNAAGKALLDQIGGVAVAVNGDYVSLPGNLDLTNITEGGFANSQKAESYTPFMLSGTHRTIGDNTVVEMPDLGPVSSDGVLTSIQMCETTGMRYVTGGSFDVYLNGQLVRTLEFDKVAESLNDIATASFNMELKAGDSLRIDPAKVILTTVEPNAGAVATSTTTTVSPPLPVDLVQGNILFMVAYAADIGANNITLNSQDWVKVDEASGVINLVNLANLTAWWRYVGATNLQPTITHTGEARGSPFSFVARIFEIRGMQTAGATPWNAKLAPVNIIQTASPHVLTTTAENTMPVFYGGAGTNPDSEGYFKVADEYEIMQSAAPGAGLAQIVFAYSKSAVVPGPQTCSLTNPYNIYGWIGGVAFSRADTVVSVTALGKARHIRGG